MRFRLFITLALLPLSTALKCYDGMTAKINGVLDPKNSRDKTILDCPLTANSCQWIHSKSAAIEIEGWFCKDILTCEKEGCGTKDMKGTPADYCCCTTDLCNESKAKASIPTKPIVPPNTKPIKCYDGLVAKKSDGSAITSEETKPKTEKQCDAGNYCFYTHSGDANVNIEGFACQDYFKCGRDDCHKTEVGGAPAEQCCCSTDLCNESKATVLKSFQAALPASTVKPSTDSNPEESNTASGNRPSTDSNGPKSDGSNFSSGGSQSGESKPSSGGKPKIDSKSSKSEESNPATAPTALLSLAAAAVVFASHL